jgi:predicted metal-dependent phosphoesterase TrpH
MLRGVFHFHSRYSFDSLSTIPAIAESLEQLQLDFAILTDHDDIQGSKALQRELKKRKLEIYVPTAAEYSTEWGDIIVVGVEKSLAGQPAVQLIKNAKEYGGLVILPHPYDAHKLTAELLDSVDVIEVFNARSSKENNEKSLVLAKRLKKPMIYAPDAHLLSNLSNCIIELPAERHVLEGIRANEARPVCKIASRKSEIVVSQIIKSVKMRDLKLLSRIFFTVFFDFVRTTFPKLFEKIKFIKSKL